MIPQKHTTAHMPAGARGIVLVEAIIAVGVLVTIFGGALTLFTRAITGVRTSSDQLIATFLAQDAMEYVMAKTRYNRVTKQPSWLEGIGCTASPCSVDTTVGISTPLSVCSGDGCRLRYDADSGIYTHGGTAALSRFSRTLSILDSVPGDDEAEATVTVSWADASRRFEIPLTITLYNN